MTLRFQYELQSSPLGWVRKDYLNYFFMGTVKIGAPVVICGAQHGDYFFFPHFDQPRVYVRHFLDFKKANSWASYRKRLRPKKSRRHPDFIKVRYEETWLGWKVAPFVGFHGVKEGANASFEEKKWNAACALR